MLPAGAQLVPLRATDLAPDATARVTVAGRSSVRKPTIVRPASAAAVLLSMLTSTCGLAVLGHAWASTLAPAAAARSSLVFTNSK